MKIEFKDMKNMNVPKYCRKIMKEENYPDTLEIYRGDMLCLTVDVLGASQLLLVEDETHSPHYRKHRSTDFKWVRKSGTSAPPVRLNEQLVGM